MPRKHTKKRIEWGLGESHKCAECGKEFHINSYQRKDWLYKKNSTLYCSYKCYRKQIVL